MTESEILEQLDVANAVEIYKVFINEIGPMFSEKNDIQFAKALLLLNYAEKDIRIIIDKYSKVPTDNIKAYSSNILKEAKKMLDVKGSGSGESYLSLMKILSQEADADRAKILAVLLLVLDREIEEKLKIELEELENEERDRQANVFAEAVRIFIELEDEIDRKLVNKKGNKR